MLLMWIKKSEVIQGVAYPSSSEIDAVRFYHAFNVAIPVRTYKQKGYCSVLEKIYKLSKPTFMDISEKMFKPIAQRFIDARNNIYYALQNLGCEPLREMVFVCDDFLLLHSKMKSSNVEDKHIIYNYINNLNLFSKTILNFKSHYNEVAKDGIRKESPKNVDQLLLQYSTAWDKFELFRELIRDYCNYFDMKISEPDTQKFEFTC